ncbi:MAG: IS1 family transposase [Planctomycetia bacterium]|nr:IS1 family transposase [Planctomycetia bacterium]
MVCPSCSGENCKRNGKDRDGNQRYICRDCKKTFGDDRPRPLGNMQLPIAKAVDCLKLLLDGMSIRAVERFTGVSRNTLCDLILQVGEQCRKFLADRLQGLPVADVQVDEVWSFVGMKEKTRAHKLDADPLKGDAYCYVGLERSTKLIVSYMLGKRDEFDTHEFASRLRQATVGRFQLSTDGWSPYYTYMPLEFGQRIDYSSIIKVYKNLPRDRGKYCPAQIVQIAKRPVVGNPDPALVCTSHVERSNLTLRMTVRRWTRLTNAFSKSWRHHEAAISLYIAFYNFVRPHMTLKTTPAVAARLTDHRWTMEELLAATAA